MEHQAQQDIEKTIAPQSVDKERVRRICGVVTTNEGAKPADLFASTRLTKKLPTTELPEMILDYLF